MKKILWRIMVTLPILWLSLGVITANADTVVVQCPGDTNGDGVSEDPNIVCMHISGGDGFSRMGDGKDLYGFSFGLVPAGTAPGAVLANMGLKARFPAPTIVLKEGQEFYLTMTNVGMVMRPDLFDPHSVHWHGFPQAAPIFDGLPEPSPTANMGASYTYYYYAAVPGTYFWHCHVEAAEHMQMGMIGNAYILPAQNELPNGTDLNGFNHQTGYKYVYNDGDGSTKYDVEYLLQFTGFDSLFHEAHIAVQPLPFAAMHDNYPMINGRGYPDTINPDPILNQEGFGAQHMSALISAETGQKILLRVSNVSTTHIYSFTTTLGVPLNVIGRGAALLRGPTGKDTSMQLSVLTVGGGQMFDVILDTTGVPAGTYFLYARDMGNLSNGDEERGGIMTEIVLTNP